MAKPKYHFPDPETSDEDGLLAVGGDLSPPCLLQAYSQGIFPWFNPKDPILWWSPNPRLILIPKDFKVSRSLKKSLKQNFRISWDSAFEQVIHACATYEGRANKTWITEEMIQAYTELHYLGYAHSLEVWQEDKLVGGLYGISLGAAFFGESMFHIVTDASKIALFCLCKDLEQRNFDFIDCQLPTPHLLSLGARIIARQEFLVLLKTALNQPTRQGKWI